MEFNTSVPIYLQVMDAIKKQLILGILGPGEQLPSTRSLAVSYNVNPNTAARIYKELELENICFTKRGLGTFVTDSEETLLKLKEPMANKVIDHFIAEMTELGYNFSDMVKIIKERERE
ncbi:MAG: GntR family transcriptional regulator [Firmicutes bacterium HGW-Firmicutes-1]|jgi:DNA-binding transcriptional regulator YhcF (GntR family)|nr:MAG: GntR family transcriptional regulator [Firmicutes bacterium HGW-Firmicutes-1]